jgi:hypothetical protein
MGCQGLRRAARPAFAVHDVFPEKRAPHCHLSGVGGVIVPRGRRTLSEVRGPVESQPGVVLRGRRADAVGFVMRASGR